MKINPLVFIMFMVIGIAAGYSVGCAAKYEDGERIGRRLTHECVVARGLTPAECGAAIFEAVWGTAAPI